MGLQLESIAFNHDTNGHASDALTIRRNASQPVHVPEWRRGVSTTADDSPAAYSLADVRGNTVYIRVELSRTLPSDNTVEVRALDLNAGGGCLYALLTALGLGWLVKPSPGNLLGRVVERKVHFGSGTSSGPVMFRLADHRLDTAGVEQGVTMWLWQYRATSMSPWIDIGITMHRVFAVLRAPTAPWQQSPAGLSNTQLPWADLLQYACSWAKGAKTADEASAAITKAIYALGPSIIEYDCPGGGSSWYSWPDFDATALLDRLGGGPGNGIYINCSDCATFTSSCANLVGADLWQSRMGWGFSLNEILAIGSSAWQTACGWGSFWYHEVAWKGACTANERVYDACLQVDGDADPMSAPHTPQLPVDMRFGNPGDGDYRDKLCPAPGGASCAPQPATRTRRPVA
jgi:hypothetical protein